MTLPSLALALLPNLASLPEHTSPPPPAFSKAAVDERLGAVVPDELRLVDSRGRDLATGRFLRAEVPVLLVLAYYRCPLLCGLNLNGLASALADSKLELGRDYRALTVSFDPRDRPDDAARVQATVLSRLGRTDARDAWPFAVAGPASIRAVTDAVGFRYALDPGSGQYAHPAVSFVLAPGGIVSRYLYGVAPASRDVDLALREPASRGGIVDRVLMTCFRYDPATRRYGPYLFGFLRIGSLFILLLVIGLGVYLVRLELRRRA